MKSFDRENSACRYPWRKPNGKRRLGQSESGQIIIEYVLLLTVAVGIAFIVTKAMVGRDPGNPGFVIAGWNYVIEAIGADKADDIQAKE